MYVIIDLKMENIRDKYGRTYEEFGKELFEFEYCPECGGDWDDHDYFLILGGFFAKCRDKNIEKMRINPDWRRIQDEQLLVINE